MALGQKFQRGPIIAFQGINPRLGGVGWAQVYSAFITALYYNVIVGYALFYFVNSFADPMPWTKADHDCPSTGIMSPVTYFWSNFLGYTDKDNECQTFEASGESFVSGSVLVCTLVTWLLVFLSLFKGIRPLSIIVYPTFLIPAVMVVVFMIYGCTLDNAQEGFDMYLKGEDSDIPPEDALEKADIWINAVA